MKLESLKPDQIVYDVHSYKMGNTTMRTMGCWTVRIVEIDLQNQSVTASWNNNAPREFYPNQWKKWRVKKPEMVAGITGRRRLKTREEMKLSKQP